MRAGSSQDPEATSGERDPFRDPHALDDLRRHTFESIGVQYGLGILYGIGVTRGLVDGMIMNRRLSSATRTSPQFPGSLIPMVFSVRRGELDGHFSGTLEGSCEAQLHARTYGVSNDPVCLVTTGYAAGWYSAVLGKSILVRETDCAACGSSTCRFEARPIEDWIEEADPWVEGLLPYLDFDRLQARAQEQVGELEDELEESNMMGSFDPMSPAVHVWGPVMVLPYSGFQDSDAAIGAIQADLGRMQIQVVVIDATGAAIDALEASGLIQLVNQLEAQRIEAILVGLSPTARHLIPAGASSGVHLQTRDISQGIALAFQVCGATLSTSGDLD
jgi:hypothetical protein